MDSIADKLVFPSQAQGCLELCTPGLTYRQWLVAKVAANTNGHALGPVTGATAGEYVNVCFAIADAVIARFDAEANRQCPGCGDEIIDGSTRCASCDNGMGNVENDHEDTETRRGASREQVSVVS